MPTQKNSASWDLQLGFNLEFKRFKIPPERGSQFQKFVYLFLILNDKFLECSHGLGLNCIAHNIRMVYKLYEGLLISP